MIGPVSVDEVAEAGVLLRRPAHHGEGPDGAGAVIDALDVQDGKVVRQTVIAQVVAERPLRQQPLRIDGAGDAEIGLGRDRQGQRVAAGVHQRDAPAAQGTGEGQFGQAFGQRHYRRQGQGRRAADDHVDAERHAAPRGPRMVDADAAMDLVVQPHLAVGLDTGCPTAGRDTSPGWSAASPADPRPRCRPAAR